MIKPLFVIAFFLSASQSFASVTLPELPYGYNALEPVIDAKTMEIHHTRHHGAQVAGLNAEIEKAPALAELSLEALLGRVSTLPPAVRNNAGGHYNHSLFWTVMAPKENTGEPSRALAKAIKRDFGSINALQTAFAAAASTRFGSGWAWLIVDKDGALKVTSTPNQDNPLMDVVEERGTPVLGLDVWEHAYYLNYQNRRVDYIAAWWQIVNWNEVSRRYGLAVKGL
jgi:superoxide dismutase, Fe-Mn family